MVFHSYFLHAQILFAGYRKPSSRLYCLVVSYYYTLPSAYITKAANCTSCWAATMLLVHAIACKSTYFYKRFISIAQISNTFPSYPFTFFVLFCNSFFAPTFIYFFKLLFYCTPSKFLLIFIFIKLNIHVFTPV